MDSWMRLPVTRLQMEVSNVKLRVPYSRPLGRELEPGSGQRRAVQAQLGLSPGVSSLAPALRNAITRGVLSLTCPRTPALCHTVGPHGVSFSHSRPSPCSEFLKKVNSRPKKSKNSFGPRPSGLGSGGVTRWPNLLSTNSMMPF